MTKLGFSKNVVKEFYSCSGSINWHSHCGNQFGIIAKLEKEHTEQTRNSTWVVYPRKTLFYVHGDTGEKDIRWHNVSNN